jgi:hypothetical protein
MQEQTTMNKPNPTRKADTVTAEDHGEGSNPTNKNTQTKAGWLSRISPRPRKRKRSLATKGESAHTPNVPTITAVELGAGHQECVEVIEALAAERDQLKRLYAAGLQIIDKLNAERDRLLGELKHLGECYDKATADLKREWLQALAQRDELLALVKDATTEAWVLSGDEEYDQEWLLRASAAIAKCETSQRGMKMPDKTANDDTPEALAAAAENFKLLRNGWCVHMTQADPAYYRNPQSGAHGWMCCKCLGIVQTG